MVGRKEVKRLGVDLDGCLADFNNACLRELQKLSPGVPLPAVPWDEWHWPEKYYAQKVVSEFWDTSGQDEMFWYNLDCMVNEDEKEQLRRLMFNHHVYFITSRPAAAKYATELWLQKHLGTQPTVIISSRKDYVAYGIGLQGILEDSHHNLVDILRMCGRTCRPVLLDQPYNAKFTHSYIDRVYNVGDGLKLLGGGDEV